MRPKCSKVESRRKKKANAPSAAKHNPFEVRVSKLKHDVIGKKVKTDKGLPGVSRSKANEKRKKTLLKEYKQRNKNNVIIDRRFGEFDEMLSSEDKMLKRFTLEKQRHHEKSGMYNLDDEEDLTHFGQKLADISTFDDAGLKLFDEEEENNDVSDHFGGFLTKKTNEQRETDKKLSREEIMEDVVANAKKRKFERQQTQEQTFELTQQLDSQLHDIQELLITRKVDKKAESKPDDYDKTVNELVFEAKGQASERMKSEEEIAREEKTRLEELERDRMKRMYGVEEDEGEENQHWSADAIVETKKKKDERYEVKYKDGAMLNPQDFDLVNAIQEIKEARKEESEGSDGGEEGESEEESDEEEDNNEDIFSSDPSESETEDAKEKIVKKKIPPKKTKSDEQVNKQIPFTYTAPSSLKELLTTLNICTKDEEIVTVLQRIRKCHHVKLDASNVQKMQNLLEVVMKYIDHLCNSESPKLSLVHKVSSFLLQLTEDVPTHAHKTFQTKLKALFKRILLRTKIRGGGMFSTLRELVFLKTIALIYPTSDLNHPVTTPALVLMAMVMNKGHFGCLKDVVSGVFLLNILYDYVKLSKRYIPEAICFIAKLLYVSSHTQTNITKISTVVLNLRKLEKDFLIVEKKSKTKISPLNISKCLSTEPDLIENDDTRLSCIRNVLLLTQKMCELYNEHDSFVAIFQPCVLLLERLPTEKYPKELRSLVDDTIALMKIEKAHAPLALQRRKPIPLALLEPKFEEDYEPRSKRKASNKTQNEMEKLKYKVKKEKKSAMREIRKDAHFLAKEKLQETMDRDADRLNKVKALERDLENERQEVKEMEKEARKSR